MKEKESKIIEQNEEGEMEVTENEKKKKPSRQQRQWTMEVRGKNAAHT